MTPKRANSQNSWILVRKITQAVALLTFLVLCVMSQRDAWTPTLVNLVMRISPLTMLSQAIASQTFLSGSLVALLLIGVTVIFGRAWCGWLCPMGTVLDLFQIRKNNQKPDAQSPLRSIKYILLVVIFTTAFLGNLTLLILDPLTLLFRTTTLSIWPAIDRIIASVERALYPIPFLSEAIASFDTWIRTWILPLEPFYYQGAVFIGLFFIMLIALNSIASLWAACWDWSAGWLFSAGWLETSANPVKSAATAAPPAPSTHNAVSIVTHPNAPCAWSACQPAHRPPSASHQD
jgi:hypothetical protein